MKRATTVMLACLMAGCFGTDFDPPYLVNSPRILAIGVEPPEVAFGEDVVFETLIVDADGTDLVGAEGVELRFMVCVSAKAVIDAAGLGFGSELDDNCDEGGDDLVQLEQGGDLPPGTARLPGAALLALLEDFMAPPGGGMDPPGGNAGIDPEVLMALATVIAEVGVPLRMHLEVWRDGELLLTGFKRFAIAQRADVTTNPPPPLFAIGDVTLSARDGGDPHTCVPDGGAAPVVDAEAEVTFAPDENEDWIETYPVVGLDGEVQTGEEGAYYSWFSTGGDFSESITRRPDRDVTWTAPEEPGTYPIWLVVRDGHLGTSWCRTEVVVE